MSQTTNNSGTQNVTQNGTVVKKNHVFEIKYRLLNGSVRYCRAESAKEKDEKMHRLYDYGLKIISCRKLYPFNTRRYRHLFVKYAKVCENAQAWLIKDAESGNQLDIERLKKYSQLQKMADRFSNAEWPTAWVPHEELKDMRMVLEYAENKRQVTTDKRHVTVA